MRSLLFLGALIVAVPSATPARDIAATSGLHDQSKTHAISPELRGDIYVARKMYRDAIDMYRETPPTPQLLNKIGIAYQLMSRPDLARKSYQQAVHLDPTFASAVNNIGTTYYEERQYRRAISFYKRSLRISGHQASVL